MRLRRNKIRIRQTQIVDLATVEGQKQKIYCKIMITQPRDKTISSRIKRNLSSEHEFLFLNLQ